MSTNDISRYLVKANGTSFTSDNELQSLAVNSKVTNINSGLTYKKTALNVYDKTPIEVETDAVLYTEQTLTAAQKSQARQNILAGQAQGLSLSPTTLDLQSAFGGTLSSIPLSSFVKTDSFYSKTQPTWTTLFTSSTGLDSGDINLNSAFTNFEYLVFVFGTDDNGPSSLSGPWDYSIHPVWMLKQLIIDDSCFGRTGVTKMNIAKDFERRWEIDPSQSTSTVLKHLYNNKVYMWRVYGVGTGSSSSSSSSESSSNSGSSSESSSGSSSSGTWGTTLFDTLSSPQGTGFKTIGQTVSEGTVVREYHVTHWEQTGTSSYVPSSTKCYYVWKANGYTLTNADKTQINNLTSGMSVLSPQSGGSVDQLTYDSGNV